MKPKELIILNIEEFLLEPLTEKGFKFSKSSLTFKRVQNEFIQTIDFQLNRYNQEDICAEFWCSSLGVSSKFYTSWYKTQYGEEPVNNSLGGAADWNIKNWKFPVIDGRQENHYQIINPDHRFAVMSLLKNNILELGLPFLENLSNWENAALKLIENDWFHSKACDFYLIANNKEKALWALKEGIECWQRKPKASFPEEKEEIKLRLEKYFGL